MCTLVTTLIFLVRDIDILVKYTDLVVQGIVLLVEGMLLVRSQKGKLPRYDVSTEIGHILLAFVFVICR